MDHSDSFSQIKRDSSTPNFPMSMQCDVVWKYPGRPCMRPGQRDDNEIPHHVAIRLTFSIFTSLAEGSCFGYSLVFEDIESYGKPISKMKLLGNLGPLKSEIR